MNLLHRRYCRSAEWGRLVADELVPWVLADLALGPRALELGPGPGLTTQHLCRRTAHLTAVEIDARDAAKLAERHAADNVTVVLGDATDLPFPEGSFTGVVSMTMLHHVPSTDDQDRLFAQALRVLEPGGVFCGCDSRPNLRWRLLHVLDTCTVLEPETLHGRLERAGFEQVAVDTTPRRTRFRARRPT
ncbi:MAG: class I SAM-dependent methyltransferase [Actinomycetes bacterium]